MIRYLGTQVTAWLDFFILIPLYDEKLSVLTEGTEKPS